MSTIEDRTGIGTVYVVSAERALSNDKRERRWLRFAPMSDGYELTASLSDAKVFRTDSNAHAAAEQVERRYPKYKAAYHLARLQVTI